MRLHFAVLAAAAVELVDGDALTAAALAGGRLDVAEPPSAAASVRGLEPERRHPSDEAASSTTSHGHRAEEQRAAHGHRAEEQRAARLRTSTSASASTSTATTTSITGTSTTNTATTSTTSTSTSTTGPHVFGGNLTRETFYGWLSVWRSKYEIGVWNANLTDPWESAMPEALKGHQTRVVKSSGGVAGGVVTEGMGYGIMVEGFLAAGGNKTALNMSLSLIKSWLAMVNGAPATVHPFGAGINVSGSSTKVGTWPYGVSAIEWSHYNTAAAGVPSWKFPINESDMLGEQGSATDADQDAVIGMIYVAKALGFPGDFVDMVVRTVIAFASADLGFPDLYRTLPGGEKVYIPKLGSMWGGLLPGGGRYKTSKKAWCYSPGYFAPAHYRTFRDFLISHWQTEFDDYLPPHQDGRPSTLVEIVEALDSAIVAGYNILWYSSCSSGTVSNWVGVKAKCADDDALNCPGVPWAHTPYIGEEAGECHDSGTRFGAFGADASRTAWRVALDYVLYEEESNRVTIYDRDGYPYSSEVFGAQTYLNRIVAQYAGSSRCDGGVPGSCLTNTTSPFRLSYAFDPEQNASDMTCDGVPNEPESWWAGFMAYPTFAAFVAPHDEIGAEQMSNWMDTFASICNFSKVDFLDFNAGKKPEGGICVTSYFEASQAVISLMIMAGFASPLNFAANGAGMMNDEVATILKDEAVSQPVFISRSPSLFLFVSLALVTLMAVGAGVHRGRRRIPAAYSQLAPLETEDFLGGCDDGSAREQLC